MGERVVVPAPTRVPAQTGPVEQPEPAPAVPSGHTALRFRPAQAVMAGRLVSSSAVPMPAPGTLQVRGPSAPATFEVWYRACVEASPGATSTDAGPGAGLGASARAASSRTAHNTDGLAAPQAADDEVVASTTGSAAGALTEGVTDDPLAGDPAVPGQDVERVGGAGTVLGTSGARGRRYLGADVRYVRTVEQARTRADAVAAGGAAPVEVEPLTADRVPVPDDAAAREQEQVAARIEAGLASADEALEPERATAPPAEETAPVERAPEVGADQGGSPVDQPEQSGAEQPVAEEPSPDVAAWQGRVQAAASRLPRPAPADPAPTVQEIRGTGGGATRAQDAKAKEAPEKAKKVLAGDERKPLPTVPGMPSPDPLPGVTRSLKELAARTLPTQQMPALLVTPGGFLPTVGGAPLNTKAPPAPPPPAKTTRGRASSSAAEDVNAALAKPGPVPVPGQGQTLSGSEQPPTAVIAEPYKADITKVLAAVHLKAATMGDAVVDDARATAYGVDLNGRASLKEVGRGLRASTTGWFRDELGRVADAAQIGKAALDAAVTARAKELQDKLTTGAQDVTSAAAQEKFALKKAGTAAQDAIEASARAWESYFDDLAGQAKGGVDPKAVRAEQARLTTEVRDFTNTHTTAWAGMKKIRDRDLVRAGQDQLAAYKAAVLADQGARAAKAAVPGATPPTTGARAPGVPPVAPAPVTEVTDADLVAWLAARTTEVGKAVGALRADLDKEVERWTLALQGARDEGVRTITAWADRRIGRERSWFEELIAKFLASLVQKQGENKALAQAQTEETTVALATDLQLLEDLKAGGLNALDRGGREALAAMNEDEQKMLTAYFEAGPQGDTVEVLATLMSNRMRRQRKPEAVKAIRAEVLTLDPVTYWADLAVIGTSQNKSFNASAVSDQLWQAFEHTWGTDEAKAFTAVQGLTAEQGMAVRGHYKKHHKGEDLDWRMKEELSGTDLERVTFGIDGRAAEADAAALREAVDQWGTDEELINKTLRHKSAAERAAIKEAYRTLYGEDLKTRLDDELSGDDKAITDAHWDGNTEKADAIEIKVAREGFWGPDHEKIETVYTRVRDEATQFGDARGWTTAEIGVEIAKRTDKMGQEYQGYTDRALLADLETTFTPPVDHIRDPGQREAVTQYWSGRRDLVMGLATGDLTRADAGKIQIERTGIYAKDETINKVLALQYSRAYDNARRDAVVAFQRANGRSPKKDELKAIESAAELTAKREGTKSMNALGAYVETHYTGGKETFRETILDLTSGTDRLKANALVKQGGFLEDWQVLRYATKGDGTDEDAFKAVIKKQKTKADIDRLEARWQRETGTSRTIKDLISDETSGRDENDLLVDYQFGGEPEDPDVAVKKAEAQLDFERRSGGITTYVDELGQVHTVKNAEYESLELRLADMQAKAKELDETKNLPESDPRRLWAEADWDERTKNFASGVETHRFLVDQRTELAAQIVTMAVTITVAVLITVATGGVGSFAGAALIAGVSSLFGAAAGIATKMSMKGAAYGDDELGLDIALGVVDAVVSAATAGVGGKILKGATATAKAGGIGARGAMATLGRMAEGTAVKRAAAHAIAEGAEGFLQSLPTAVLGTALNEKTWSEGNPLFNMLAGVGMGVGMGTVASGMIGGLTNLKGPKAGVAEAAMPPTLRGSLVDAVPGSAERIHLEARYLELNPTRTRADFQRDLDGIVMLQAKHSPEMQVRLEQRLRTDICDLLPPAQKSLLADSPVEMWDAKRFEAFTGSDSGQAVVIVKDGRPTVIVKQGADPHALAEEGFHLLQAIDPATRAKVARLDESVLSRWHSLDVREKLALYKEKLDLELRAQRDVIRALEERASAAGMTDDVAERLISARETLANLRRRARDLRAIGPFERSLMGLGVLPQPRWLDQPARLFTKKKAVVASTKKKAGTASKKKAAVASKKKVAAGAPTKVGAAAPKKTVAAATKKKAPVTPPTPPPPTTKVKPPAAPEDSARVARNAKSFAAEIADAHARGRTAETPAYRVRNTDHPLLREQMETMQSAVRRYDADISGVTDPAALERAAKRLRSAVMETHDVLRSFSDRFTTTPGLDPGFDTAGVAQRARSLRPSSVTPQRLGNALTVGKLTAEAGGVLGESIPRKTPGVGLEKYLVSARMSALATRPPWLRRALRAMLRGWERAHLIGPGFGGEVFAGLALAPNKVNQIVQNRGIEKMLRQAARVADDVHVTVKFQGQRLAVPLENGSFDFIEIARRIEYRVPSSAAPNGFYKFVIEIDLDSSWRVHQTFPPGSLPPGFKLTGRR